MPEHPPSTQLCCTEKTVDALTGLLRLTAEYETQQITETLIKDLIDVASAFATGQGHVTTDLDESLVLGTVEMRFTIHTPEAQRLVGDQAGHDPWLRAKRAELFVRNGFWDNYRRLLENRIPESARNRLDEITDDVMDNLEDPTRPGQWDRRGLVMGHVQSGKTNNYVGLICKAADAGYKLIVVLAGMHNNLRTQTQFRVDEGFTGRDTRDEAGVKSDKLVGVGLEHDRGSVFSLTSASDGGDFNAAVASAVGVDFGNIDHPTIFVVKKNAHILANLYQWLQDNAPKPPGHKRIASIPFLLIDDEADSASIDTVNHQRNPDMDPARINREIRKLLNAFDQSAYVGYTATPFANIFIDDQVENEEFGMDLFPRSFIFSLQPPENYVGPDTVFGLPKSGNVPDDDDVAPPFVADVMDYEDWLPDRHGKDVVVDYDVFPESLRRAIGSFVVSSAARRLRGQGSHHHSMLVHVTRFVNTQAKVREQVSDYLITLRNNLLYNDTATSNMMTELEEIWNEDFLPLTAALNSRGATSSPTHSFDAIRGEIIPAVTKIQVRAINGSSADVLDYHNHSQDGLSVIVVGGAKLSRGLTLEGLSVSYYLRASRMYDTLMQMGRWFGYRPGYLDLCRIYTTPAISESYRRIALATNELLDEFAEMHNENATPAEFGLKVRHSPGMLVTSLSKMRNGTRRRVSFADSRPEVTSFSIDPSERQSAVDEMERLIESLGPPSDGHNAQNRGWFNIDYHAIVTYFRSLERQDLYSQSRSALPVYIADYVEKRARQGGLVNWTVLLKSSSADDAECFTIAGHEIGMARRSHNGSSNLGTYSIKSLIGSQDEAFDLTEDELNRANAKAKGGIAYGTRLREQRPQERGLLILYLLSSPTKGNPPNVADGAPFAAYCVSFPNDPSGTSIEYVVNNVFDLHDGDE